ncbi:hypothetical protein [Scytonema sp. NUACC26]|uniref:hypothetical protein n=1 Tax=Scytonema sp. NUACC26 TaxID=3140176 RepID=UPI0034DC362C
MDTSTPFDKENLNSFSQFLHDFEEMHREDLATVTHALAKITNLTPSEIKPYLDTILLQIVESKKRESTSQERKYAFNTWVQSHEGQGFPLLSDEAISRETIYGERD